MMNLRDERTLELLDFTYVEETFDRCELCEACNEEFAEAGSNWCIYCLESVEQSSRDGDEWLEERV